ncbi:MAG: glycine cleavage system protein R [Candidatus Marinimicrobia bacterium]|nr:glycine cleavage system protein R [Candidatus Neomarinimicrobiota bacterium]MBT6869860.1 glycine cleavage system protein R [Candidatus Neomarinimicrobiota bacterium]MBT7376623.1 glycine cleavage system protein R [Candidatus Neomarinimicrobiota bacterium]
MDHIIISAFGSDRPGIVSHLTGAITSHGGNIEESRMVKLGTDFTTMIFVSVSTEWTESLTVALNGIQDLQITVQKTSPFSIDATIPQCEIHLSGADNEGLVHKVAERLAEKGINIEEMETGTENAPISGTILFTMTARVSHPELDTPRLENDMNELADKLGVRITIN